MNRKRCLAAGLALLLCGCQTVGERGSPVPEPALSAESATFPASEPASMLDLPDGTVSLDGKEYHYNPDSASHDTYEIHVGDGEHIFRLEAVSAGLWANEFCRDLTLSFYEEEGRTPLQVIETDVGVWPQSFKFYVEDIDFDGDMDFYYLYSQGTHNRYCCFFVWDAETEQFIYDPYGLNGLANVRVDGERRVVLAGSGGGFYGATDYYRYDENRELELIRSCNFSGPGYGETTCWMSVSEEKDGAWQEVFRVEREEEWLSEDWDEYTRWHDLHYHGPHTLALDIGDGEHSFWVEITPRESEEEGIPITVSVYDSEEKNTLWQRWEDVCYRPSFETIGLTSQDVDFDGNMDLIYSSWLAASTWGMNYWVWDAGQEKFVHDPYGLEGLSEPEFDQEKNVIATENHDGGGYKTEEYYRYQNGKLTCIRRLSTRPGGENWCATLTVEDYRNGKLQEVYRAEHVEDDGVLWPSTEEFRKWYDLNYHGEETP